MVDGARRKEIYELFKTQEFKQPEIYLMRPKKDTLTIHGNRPLADFIREEAIPSDFEVVRVECGMNTGVTYTDHTAVAVRIFAPDVSDLFRLRSAFQDSVREVLAQYGVEVKPSSHRKAANDLVFVLNGVEKKFCGCVHDLAHHYLGFILTFDFGADKIPGLYKMNTLKMLSRGPVTDITDVVGGLREANPELDPDKVGKEIIEAILQKMEWEV